MNAKIMLFVNANVISFVTTLQSKRIHKCNCNRISRHTDPMCNIIRILRTRLQQQTQLAYPPPCSPAFWFFKFCATFTAHNIDILHFVCTPRGQSHVPLFHRLFPFPTFDYCVFIFFNHVHKYNFIIRREFCWLLIVLLYAITFDSLLMHSVWTASTHSTKSETFLPRRLMDRSNVWSQISLTRSTKSSIYQLAKMQTCIAHANNNNWQFKMHF